MYQNPSRSAGRGGSEAPRACSQSAPAPVDYSLAVYTVRFRKPEFIDLIEITEFDDAVSPSTARLVSLATQSLQELGPKALPVEALAAVHYFASSIDKPASFSPSQKRAVGMTSGGKVAYSWSSAAEEAALGSLLLRLAEAVRPICANEPRLLRLSSPVYAIGDLHGNLAALLALESALWSGGTALQAARLLFLGDYVDRGAYGTELMAYLLAAKLQRPSGVFLVRGNHETRDIQKMFTFYQYSAATEASPRRGYVRWYPPSTRCRCRCRSPACRACSLGSCCGTIPSSRPNKITTSIQLELASNEGFAVNTKRGTGHMFDQNALDRFLVANQLSHVVRAHEVQENGFQCQLRGRLVTVFSSYRYCGSSNDSGVVMVEGGKLRMIRLNAD